MALSVYLWRQFQITLCDEMTSPFQNNSRWRGDTTLYQCLIWLMMVSVVGIGLTRNKHLMCKLFLLQFMKEIRIITEFQTHFNLYLHWHTQKKESDVRLLPVSPLFDRKVKTFVIFWLTKKHWPFKEHVTQVDSRSVCFMYLLPAIHRCHQYKPWWMQCTVSTY